MPTIAVIFATFYCHSYLDNQERSRFSRLLDKVQSLGKVPVFTTAGQSPEPWQTIKVSVFTTAGQRHVSKRLVGYLDNQERFRFLRLLDRVQSERAVRKGTPGKGQTGFFFF